METEGAKNCTLDSPDTNCQSVEDKSDGVDKKEASMSESQDFHLVDSGDEEALNDSRVDSGKAEREERSSGLEIGESGAIDAQDVSNSCKDVASSDLEKEDVSRSCSIVTTNEEVMPVKNQSDEDDEIIQCTQPEVHSPGKKLLLANAESSRLKRKVELFDEPPCKIARRTSQEDGLTEEKRKLEAEDEENDRTQLFHVDDTNVDFEKDDASTNVIIAETQETIDDKPIEGALKNTEENEDQSAGGKELDLNIARVQQSENDNFIEKDYEIDKNKNLNSTSKLSEPVANNDPKEKIYITETTATKPTENNSTTCSLETEKTDSNSQKEIVKAANDSQVDKEDTALNSSKENNTEKSSLSEERNENGVVSSNNKVDIEICAKEPTKNHNSEETTTKEVPKTTNERCSNGDAVKASKSRMSIEIVYDRTVAIQEAKSRPKEIVEIDEDGEKVVLDSSQEDSKTESKSILDNTTYKGCYENKSSSDFSYKSVGSTKESSLDIVQSDRLVNGSTESKRCDTDSTASIKSDIFVDIPGILERAVADVGVHTTNNQLNKNTTLVFKDNEHGDLLSISENEPNVTDVSIENKNKSDMVDRSPLLKGLQIEKEIGIFVKMKCLLHVDEATKEFLNKEVTAVHCESIVDPSLLRQSTKNLDTSASLADISGNDNKDGSPGSVNSNPQMYSLNPRLSFASTVSSLSSVSSAASLAAKLALKDSIHFSLPRVPTRHARKPAASSFNDKESTDGAYERLSREWQNSRLLTNAVLNFANSELVANDTYNISSERIDDQLQKLRSSTPEVPRDVSQAATPKTTKKGKVMKRPRSKITRAAAATSSESLESNGLTKISPKAPIPSLSNNDTPSRKKSKVDEHVSMVTSPSTLSDSIKSTERADGGQLIGKQVFAKWSDNNYYPGIVIDKIKAKYKVNFYDGKNKVLIEDFVIPIPKTLSEGLSVYATSNDDYGSCGIIVDVETVKNQVYYVVETDEGDKSRVKIKDIFLTSDQAQILRDSNSESTSNPSTPKHLGHVSLDNMVEGKRRSKRIGTPLAVFSTPKSRSGISTPRTPTSSSKHVAKAEPSVSGLALKTKKKETKLQAASDFEGSDSSVSLKEDPLILSGVQPEIIGTPNEQLTKGPQGRLKSKSRSKKRTDDHETIAILGPIPPVDSVLFKNMSFILTCASLESIDRYQTDNKDCESDTGTENEEEWVKKPFVRDRLVSQIISAGGKVYEEFDEIPQDEYAITKLITNVPNTTAKTLLCLSVGIPAYNHSWIIRCCHQGKIVNPAEDELPSGWSLERQCYVEMFQRPSKKPLTQVVVIIPIVECDKLFTKYWSQICENAGAIVLIAENAESMEGFVAGTVVLTNTRCPTWAVEKATELQIPLLSSTWIVQCLIEGKLCSHYSQPRYKYNYRKN